MIMRPLNVRARPLLRAAGTLFLGILSAAAAAWIAWQQALLSFDDPFAWALASCALIALVVPWLVALSLARRLSRARSELEEAARAAAGARSRELALRSADRIKDEFLAMLSHELRNPLAAMSAAAHLLRKITAEPLAVQSVETIARQVGHMTRLIEDLLDVTRVTRGKVSLSRRPLDLARAVQKTLEDMRLAGRLAAHEIRADLSPAWVRADDARLQQIVANLVGNAVKYTPEGGRIAIHVRRTPNESILRVQDSGVGLSPELAARVFDLFVQGEASERRGGGGLGIGLTLVKHLAELHGGKVYAASSGAGEGSVFTVAFPAIEAQSEPEAALPAPEPGQARHSILLVEDNADTRNTMFAALEQEGHRVYEAADGNAGLRTAGTVKPEVAVIDIGLPELDGYAMATELRHNPEHERMVLIAMTGLERPDSLRRAREAGFDEYLTKPVDPDRLVRAIDAALAAKARRAGGARPAL
jgi:signal transduction histidine kinase/CheY-like chemotaxis protein